MNLLLNDKDDLNVLIAERLQEKEFEKEKNISIIRKCFDDLHQLQNKLNVQIQKSLKMYEDEIKNIELSFNQYRDSIRQLCNQNLEQSLQTYYQLEDQLINYNRIKQMLIENLNKIQITKRLDQINKNLNEIKQLYQKSEIQLKIETLFKNIRGISQGKDMVCVPHKAEICMVDLNKQSIIPNRFACSKCYNQNRSRNFTPINIFQDDVNQFQSRKLFYINTKIQEIENSSTIINNLIKDFGNQTNIEIQNSINLNLQYKDFYFKTLQSQKLDIVFKYSDLQDNQMIEIANQLSNPNSFKIFKQNVDSQYHQFITESKKLLGQFLKGNQIRSQSLKNPEFKLLQNINKQDNQQKQNKKMYLLWIFLPIILAILCIIQLNLFQISTQVIDFDQSINSQAFNSSQNKSQDNDIFIIDSIHKHISKEDNQSNINFNITRPGVDINQEQIYKFKENKSLLEKAQQNQKKKTYQQEQLEKSFKYELIYSINQSQWCGAISFNKDSSFLIASSEKNINIFEFKKGLIQTLEQHKDWVTALYFMKNSNDFISGSADKSIIIWKFMENKLWQRKQQLIGHESTINRVIMNSKEDLIISCSSDKTIKIWKKQNDLWFLAQTILEHNKDVYSISLSESENKLISCGQDGQILVMEQQKNNQEWIVIQKIETKVFGYRLSFIGDNQFTFQPHRGEFMHLYELNNLTKQYLKIKDIQVKNGNVEDQSLFSQQYIKEKSLLINKYGRVINLVQKNQNGEFLNKQQIEFGHYYLYGSVTDNGEYLVTWNSKNNQLQIRQFQEK